MSDTEKNKGHAQKSNFSGECNDLKGHVFETFMESKDSTQYNKTVKALQVFVVSKFRSGGDVGWMLKHEKKFTLSKPTQPKNTTTTMHSQDALDQDIYKKQKNVRIKEGSLQRK